MMKVFIDEPDASPQLKAQIDALLATHRGAADLVDRIETLREQLAEYRRGPASSTPSSSRSRPCAPAAS